MKKIKKIFASLLAVTSLAVCMTGMSANATTVKSGTKDLSPSGKLNGSIELTWYTPIGGVNVYTLTAYTSASGVTGSYTLHTGIELVDYPSGNPRQSNYTNTSSASVSGGAVYGKQGVVYSNHEIRGSRSDILYLVTDPLTL